MLLANDLLYTLQGSHFLPCSFFILVDLLEINPVGGRRALDDSHIAIVNEHLGHFSRCQVLCEF